MNRVIWVRILDAEGVYHVGYYDQGGIWHHDDRYHSVEVADARVLFLNAGHVEPEQRGGSTL